MSSIQNIYHNIYSIWERIRKHKKTNIKHSLGGKDDLLSGLFVENIIQFLTKYVIVT